MEYHEFWQRLTNERYSYTNLEYLIKIHNIIYIIYNDMIYFMYYIVYIYKHKLKKFLKELKGDGIKNPISY